MFFKKKIIILLINFIINILYKFNKKNIENYIY